MPDLSNELPSNAGMAFGHLPPVLLPSIEQLQKLLPWAQRAPFTRPGPLPETWRDLAHGATRILPFLWAGYPGSPFHYFDAEEGNAPVTPSDLFLMGEPDDLFDDHARMVGPEAAATAIILADVAESLDLTTPPGRPCSTSCWTQSRAATPTSGPGRKSCLRRSGRRRRRRSAGRVCPVRPSWPISFATSIRRDRTARRLCGPRSPTRLAPSPFSTGWSRERLAGRPDPTRTARRGRGRHSRHGQAVARARLRPRGLAAQHGCHRRQEARYPRPGRPQAHQGDRKAVPPPRTRKPEGQRPFAGARPQVLRSPPSIAADGPDTEKCSWHNLYDRMVRVHIPDRNRLGDTPDLSEAKEVLGLRAFTTVAILALIRHNWRSQHSGLAELCFETAMRAAAAGALDLDAIVSAGEELGDSPEAVALVTPLKPVPDIHDIRGLIPDTQWAPVSAEPGQQYGWPSVIENARRLGRDALGIDNDTWTRLEERIDGRGAAAAVLYAAPRPHLAPEPRLIDRIARLRSRYDRSWSPGIHARAVAAIETEIDMGVIAALESSEFQPEAPELLPGADIVARHGPRSIRELVGDGSEPDWDELAAAGHGLATGRLHLSEEEWRRACRILGPHRAAAAAFAAAAFEEEQNRSDFARVVFHEATRPGSLPELLRNKWILRHARDSFTLADPPSLESAP